VGDPFSFINLINSPLRIFFDHSPPRTKPLGLGTGSCLGKSWHGPENAPLPAPERNCSFGPPSGTRWLVFLPAGTSLLAFFSPVQNFNALPQRSPLRTLDVGEGFSSGVRLCYRGERKIEITETPRRINAGLDCKQQTRLARAFAFELGPI